MQLVCYAKIKRKDGRAIMKIAIIGYGGRGRLYSSILKDKEAEIVAICDCDKEKLNLAKKN